MKSVIIFTNQSVAETPVGMETILVDFKEEWISHVNAAHTRNPDADVIVWDQRVVGPLNWKMIHGFMQSKDDVWHAGADLTDVDDEQFLVYIEPYLNYRPTPAAGLDRAVNWKIAPACVMIHGSVLKATGGIEFGYDSPAMSFADLGYYVVKNGGVVRQRTVRGVGAIHGKQTHVPSRKDIYSFINRHYGRSACRYVLFRRTLAGKNYFREAAAFRSAWAHTGQLKKIDAKLARSISVASMEGEYRVSIVLPTFGRYPYLAEVLDDIRKQTIKPIQILVAEGNERIPENENFYKNFNDLPLEVVWLDKEGTCYSRNRCIERVRGNYIWILDDDSRIDPDNLENHLRVLEMYDADVSVGPAYTKDRPDLFEYQKHVACTFMDCGTTLLKTSMVEKAGGFDMQYNNYLANEDGELGIRFVRAGGLMVNNPHARRFHYLAPIGGCRTSSNNLHRWKRWSLKPRPVQSTFYTGLKHYSRKATWEATLRHWVLVGRKKKPKEPGNFLWNVKYILAEILALPLSLYRLQLSIRLAKRMFRQSDKEPYFNFNKE